MKLPVVGIGIDSEFGQSVMKRLMSHELHGPLAKLLVRVIVTGVGAGANAVRISTEWKGQDDTIIGNTVTYQEQLRLDVMFVLRRAALGVFDRMLEDAFQPKCPSCGKTPDAPLTCCKCGRETCHDCAVPHPTIEQKGGEFGAPSCRPCASDAGWKEKS